MTGINPVPTRTGRLCEVAHGRYMDKSLLKVTAFMTIAPFG
jgi:hypothetical protein